MPGMDGMETAKVLRQDNESVIQESISRLIRSLRAKNGSTDK